MQSNKEIHIHVSQGFGRKFFRGAIFMFFSSNLKIWRGHFLTFYIKLWNEKGSFLILRGKIKAFPIPVSMYYICSKTQGKQNERNTHNINNDMHPTINTALSIMYANWWKERCVVNLRKWRSHAKSALKIFWGEAWLLPHTPFNFHETLQASRADSTEHFCFTY